MICLRCGYCCQHLAVVIVDDPQKGPEEGNLIVHEGHGVPCKHLQGSRPGGYSCAIHDEPWYQETPCAQHGQIESNPWVPCRMGEYVLGGSRPNFLAAITERAHARRS